MSEGNKINKDFLKDFDKNKMKRITMQIFYLDSQTELDTIGDLELVGNLFNFLNENQLENLTDVREYQIDDFASQIVNNLLQNKGYENDITFFHHDYIIE